VRVLIAEDDPASRRLLEVAIGKLGYEPVVTHDGEEALAVLQGEGSPDVAILDWMMPEMDGPEVCRRVRADAARHRPYIILLTARVQPEDLVEGLSAGADDYVRKPFNRAELAARLRVGERTVGLQRTLAGRVKELEVAMTLLNGLQQDQKLEALGRLASGVAHEINTPIHYVGDNLRFLAKSWSECQPILETHASDDQIAYLIHEVPRAIDESLAGIARVGAIVRAMRDFSHPASDKKTPVDINRTVETTISVTTNEWKYVAKVTTELDPDLPKVMALSGEIHQVLLNLVVNAAQALADAAEPDADHGRIHIETSAVDGWVEIRVRDNGPGIPEEVRAMVFEPFFTTKEIGKGTGQGLAIAHAVVVQQHGGCIWFDSDPGGGTTFFVRIPVDDAGGVHREHEEADSVRR
jgi:signal transduction histidine kinase